MTTTSKTIGFISLGLIGGSIAKTIRRIHPNYRLIAYNRTLSAAEAALDDGVIDQIIDEVDNRFAECDYIFLCAPVSINISYLQTIKGFIRPGTILTDVGSTKGDIDQEIRKAGLTEYFIGGHPMAGSEKTGYESATPYLLENAYYILTPTEDVSVTSVEDYVQLVESIGALPLVLDSTTHDHATAAVSHVPHLIAAALVNLIKDNDNEEQIMKTIAAGGFKDITRIASASPAMWEQICLTNHTQVAEVLARYIASLQKIEEDVRHLDGKALNELFDTAGEYRNSLSSSGRGAVQRHYQLFCDIIDESGAIATIATILATNGISIKNIGIVHNREFAEGVLHMEFYDEPAKTKAVALLERHRYTVYQR